MLGLPVVSSSSTKEERLPQGTTRRQAVPGGKSPEGSTPRRQRSRGFRIPAKSDGFRVSVDGPRAVPRIAASLSRQVVDIHIASLSNHAPLFSEQPVNVDTVFNLEPFDGLRAGL